MCLFQRYGEWRNTADFTARLCCRTLIQFIAGTVQFEYTVVRHGRYAAVDAAFDVFAGGIAATRTGGHRPHHQPHSRRPFIRRAHRHNTSSNAVINGDHYPRLTHYIADTLARGMGLYIGQLHSPKTRNDAFGTV